MDDVHPYAGDVKIPSKKKNIIGEPYVTKFEKARIVGCRALQISLGAPLLIQLEDNEILPFEMAEIEFRARVLPIGVVRTLPNGKTIRIPIQDLKDRDSISQMID